jgi:hypothetical protein
VKNANTFRFAIYTLRSKRLFAVLGSILETLYASRITFYGSKKRGRKKWKEKIP